jgi:hypothetical protein
MGHDFDSADEDVSFYVSFNWSFTGLAYQIHGKTTKEINNIINTWLSVLPESCQENEDGWATHHNGSWRYVRNSFYTVLCYLKKTLKNAYSNSVFLSDQIWETDSVPCEEIFDEIKNFDQKKNFCNYVNKSKISSHGTSVVM